MSAFTSLWGTEIFAWCRRARSCTSSFFDAESTAFDDFTLETIFGGIGFFSSHHLDETKATRLLGVWIFHDRAPLHVAILLEEPRDLSFRQTRMYPRDEEVGARIDSGPFTVVTAAAI